MKKNNFQKWIAIFFLVLLVNTAYIAAFSSATVFYMANVLLHLGLGVVLSMAVVFTINKRRDLIAGAPIALGFFLLALIFGAVLAWRGNVYANLWLLWSHIAAAALGVLALIPYVWKQASSSGAGWLQFRKGFALASRTSVCAAGPDDRIPQSVPRPAQPDHKSPGGAGLHGWRRRWPPIPVLPRIRENERRRNHPLEFLHGFGHLRRVPQENLRGMEEFLTPFRFVQQPVLSQSHREHAGHSGNHEGEQVVRGLPRSRRILQRPFRQAH